MALILFGLDFEFFKMNMSKKKIFKIKIKIKYNKLEFFILSRGGWFDDVR